jgi:hypothetical protein
MLTVDMLCHYLQLLGWMTAQLPLDRLISTNPYDLRDMGDSSDL